MADWRVLPRGRGIAASQLQLIVAVWECELLLPDLISEDSNMYLLCEIA